MSCAFCEVNSVSNNGGFPVCAIGNALRVGPELCTKYVTFDLCRAARCAFSPLKARFFAFQNSV